MQRQTATPNAREDADQPALLEEPPDASTRPETRIEVEHIYQQRLERFARLRDEFNRRRYLAANTGVILVVLALAAAIYFVFTHYHLHVMKSWPFVSR